MPLSKEILKIATLGTAHHGLDLSVLWEGEKPERQLLQQVVTSTNADHAQIGSVAAGGVCSAEAIECLLDVLQPEDKHRPDFKVEKLNERFLRIWLAALKSKGLRIAPEYLEIMIGLANRYPQLCSEILELFDVHTGELILDYPINRDVLRYMWFRDRDPMVRESFEEWVRHGYFTLQKMFLDLLANHVRKSDEDFLELLVDVVSPKLLYVLRGLLVEIPHSSFVRKMVDYFAAYLSSIEEKDGKQRLVIDEIEMPNDPILMRYGIIEDEVTMKTAIQRVLSYVPPSFWCEHFNVSHEAFVELIASNKKFSVTIWKALTLASYHHRDGRFADDIFDHTFYQLDRYEKRVLIQAMSPNKMQQSAVEVMDRCHDVMSRRHPALPFIEGCEVEWEPFFVEAFVRMMKPTFESTSRNYLYQDVSVRVLRAAAFHVPLDMRDMLLGLFDEETDLRKRWVHLRWQIQRILEFRQALVDVLETGAI